MARNNGLDTPRETRRSIRPNYDPEAFGRMSERFARFLGTARFLVYMTVFIAFWIIWNFVAPAELRFDDYPFIFLTFDFVDAGIVCGTVNSSCTKSPSRS
jgi:uncharacterized membrane protein